MGIIENWKNKARRRSVEKFAAASGLGRWNLDDPNHRGGFVSQPERDAIGKVLTVSELDAPFPDGPGGLWPPRLEPNESSKYGCPCKNVLFGRWQGLPVTGADFYINTLRVEKFEVRPDPTLGAYVAPSIHPVFEDKYFSALIADLPAALPGLMIRKKMPGFTRRPVLRYHIESGSPEFNRTFHVTTENTAFAVKLIDASMIAWLLSAAGAFMFKLHGRNLLLVWSNLLPASGLAAIFDTAKSFTDHIPHQIWTEYGTH